MKVVSVNDYQAILDLVEHYLGIATHHNINASPSEQAAKEVFKKAEGLGTVFSISKPDEWTQS